MHKHHAESSTDKPFFGAVSTKQNPAAHGNIMRCDWCACGAIRRTNINGSHVERGLWQLPETEAAFQHQPL